MKRFVRTFATLVIGMALGTATIAAAAPGTVEAVITKFKIVVNGQEAQLQNSPLVVNGTTYLPVREVASILNADLKYNGTSKSIELSTKGDVSMNPSAGVTTEWITLRDLAEKHNFSVSQTSTSNGLFEVRTGDQVVFSFDAEKVTLEGYTTYTPNGHSIKIKKDMTNSTVINVADLVSAGIIQ
ncbi:hypothetical protein D3C76_180030 [compost metagenome]